MSSGLDDHERLIAEAETVLFFRAATHRPGLDRCSAMGWTAP
jgi:hypothetical protein